jgi:hypothetical protein
MESSFRRKEGKVVEGERVGSFFMTKAGRNVSAPSETLQGEFIRNFIHLDRCEDNQDG